jgi:hypothetical protein
VGAAARAALPAALATLLAAFAILPPAPAAAAAQVDVFIEVNPSTIQVGYQVGIRANCGEDLNQATARSGAFGEITLTPRPESGLMLGSATVPLTTPAGEYHVDLSCANGATARAELFVLAMAQPTRGPETGGGGTRQAGGAADAGPVGTGAAGDGNGAGPLLLAGAGAAALATATGLLLGRRRRTG